MEQKFSISKYPDAATINKKLDELKNMPIYSIKPEVLAEIEAEYFDGKCAGSKAMVQDAMNYIPGGVQHNLAFNHPFPLAINKAEGAYLYDIDGNKYYDFLQAGGPIVLGSNPEPVRNKVIELLNNGGPSTGLFHEYEYKLAKKISGLRDDVQDDSVVSLDDRMLQTPSIALQATISEIGRMGEVVKGTLEVAREVLFTQKSGDIQRLRDDESVVDKFCHGITEYILKISGLQISEKEHTHSARLLQVVNHIERISDYCENISEFAEELKNDKIQFSESGREELQEMIDVCFGSYNYAIEAFIEGDRQKAWKVVEKERKADELEDTLRRKHIKRLTNHQCNTEAGIVFLDMLVCLERISDHARNIAEEVLEHEDY